MSTRDSNLDAAHDGPIPPAALAAARWGSGAWTRLQRGADLASIEARLRDCVAALARLRSGGLASAAAPRLARMIADYRRAAAAMLA